MCAGPGSADSQGLQNALGGELPGVSHTIACVGAGKGFTGPCTALIWLYKLNSLSLSAILYG